MKNQTPKSTEFYLNLSSIHIPTGQWSSLIANQSNEQYSIGSSVACDLVEGICNPDLLESIIQQVHISA